MPGVHPEARGVRFVNVHTEARDEQDEEYHQYCLQYSRDDAEEQGEEYHYDSEDNTERSDEQDVEDYAEDGGEQREEDHHNDSQGDNEVAKEEEDYNSEDSEGEREYHVKMVRQAKQQTWSSSSEDEEEVEWKEAHRKVEERKRIRKNNLERAKRRERMSHKEGIDNQDEDEGDSEGGDEHKGENHHDDVEGRDEQDTAEDSDEQRAEDQHYDSQEYPSEDEDSKVDNKVAKEEDVYDYNSEDGNKDSKGEHEYHVRIIRQTKVWSSSSSSSEEDEEEVEWERAHREIERTSTVFVRSIVKPVVKEEKIPSKVVKALKRLVIGNPVENSLIPLPLPPPPQSSRPQLRRSSSNNNSIEKPDLSKGFRSSANMPEELLIDLQQ